MNRHTMRSMLSRASSRIQRWWCVYVYDIVQLETCSRVNSTQRFKGLLSDGGDTIRVSFASDLFEAFSGEDSTFKAGSTIQLDDYILNHLDGIPILQVRKCHAASAAEGALETTPIKQTVKREREDENGMRSGGNPPVETGDCFDDGRNVLCVLLVRRVHRRIEIAES